MPWKKEETVFERRKEFVLLADQPTSNMSRLCRWRRHGEQGLADRSRRPHHCPNQTPDEVEQQVLSVRRQYPEWGG